MNDLFDFTERTVLSLAEPSLAKEWERVRRLFDAPSFSVVIAGEFNRGKTTLVNRLIGTKLPTGDLPTTAILTQIVYGEKESLTFTDTNGKSERRDADEKNFVALQVDDAGDSQGGSIRYEIPCDWLERNKLAIVDTPGAGDLSDLRHEIAAAALAGADVALVAVCATMPLSMSERVYIEEYAFTKDVPYIALVITKLDLISEKERASVVQNIVARLGSWNNKVEVWLSTDDPNVCAGIDIEVKGTEAIRRGIERWRNTPEHTQLRQRQFETQLKQILRQATNVISLRLKVAAADQETIVSEKKRLRLEIESDALYWKDLELAMMQKSLDCCNLIDKTFEEREAGIQSNLAAQLKESNRPEEWMQKTLPFQLSEELKKFHEDVCGRVESRLERDIAWLQSEVSKKYASALDVDAAHLSDWSDATETAGGSGSAEKVKYVGSEWAQRIRKIRSSVRSFLSTSFRFVSEMSARLTGGKTDTDKCAEQISGIVRQTATKMLVEGKESLREQYTSITDELKRRQQDWFAVQMNTLEQHGSKPGGSAEANALQTQLTAIQSFF